MRRPLTGTPQFIITPIQIVVYLPLIIKLFYLLYIVSLIILSSRIYSHILIMCRKQGCNLTDTIFKNWLFSCKVSCKCYTYVVLIYFRPIKISMFCDFLKSYLFTAPPWFIRLLVYFQAHVFITILKHN